MDVCRVGDEFVVDVDLPGARADSTVLEVEHTVVTVGSERSGPVEGRDTVIPERPTDRFTRRTFLGETGE